MEGVKNFYLVVLWKKEKQPITYEDGVENICRAIFGSERAWFEMPDGTRREVNLSDPETWRLMLSSGIVKHSYICNGFVVSKHFLLAELLQSTDYVPKDVIDLVVRDGRERGLYKNIEGLLSLCENEDALRYFLDNGYRFKKVRGYGFSTMEYYFCGEGKLLPVIAEYPQAIDRKWIKTNKKGLMEFIFRLVKSDREDEARFVAGLLIGEC